MPVLHWAVPPSAVNQADRCESDDRTQQRRVDTDSLVKHLVDELSFAFWTDGIVVHALVHAVPMPSSGPSGMSAASTDLTKIAFPSRRTNERAGTEYLSLRTLAARNRLRQMRRILSIGQRWSALVR